jgi:hypothetical protein
MSNGHCPYCPMDIVHNKVAFRRVPFNHRELWMQTMSAGLDNNLSAVYFNEVMRSDVAVIIDVYYAIH